MSEFRFIAFTDFPFQANQSQQNVISLPIHPYEASERPIDEFPGGAHDLNVPYTVFEILVAVFAVVGNLMVIIVFQRERKLRRRTNYYIVSLAIADFLVGSLGVPFAILASIGLPTNLYACLFTVSLLIVLCTISIFCLVAVSVDRYWAILYPMAYSRNVRTKTAIIIISLCWLAGSVVGFLPLFGWHADVLENQACLFTKVMDYNYLVFLYFATIITPALLMLAFYVHIYRVIVKQVRQIVTMNPVGDCSRRSSLAQIQTQTHAANTPRATHGGTMLRVLGASRKREVKATQNLSIIVLFFMICWFPLYTINCIQAFCDTCEIPPKLTLFCIILSHLNSAVNPVLYAYHLRDFRAALKNLILRIMGVDVEPTIDAAHRFSMASQHRLQSIDASTRNTLQPRIYIDSPIWLRQQQQQALKQAGKFGVLTPCLNNLNQTVVAAVTPDVERKMWNIREVSSGAEVGEVNYVFPDEDGCGADCSTPGGSGSIPTPAPTPPPRGQRCSTAASQRTASQRRCDSPYSYDNYAVSAHDVADTSGDAANVAANVVDDVFLPPPKHSGDGNSKQLLACVLREKLRSDNADYMAHLHGSEHVLSSSSFSDCCEASPPAHSQRRRTHAAATATAASSLSSSPKPAAKTLNSLQASRPHSQSACAVANAPVYIIEQDDAICAAAHRPRLRNGRCCNENDTSNNNSNNSSRSTLSRRRASRAFSCRSDSPSIVASSTPPSPPRQPPQLRSPTPALDVATTLTALSTNNNNNNPAHSNKTIATDARGHPVLAAAKATTHLGAIPDTAQVNVNYNDNNNRGNNNSHTANNLNFYTQQQQQCQAAFTPHQPEKFSPLKAVSHFLFPPIVKHSSLFQLFHPHPPAPPTPAAATTPPTISTTASCEDELTPAGPYVVHANSPPQQRGHHHDHHQSPAITSPSEHKQHQQQPQQHRQSPSQLVALPTVDS